jgi:Amt family ammonium transporter
MITPALIVGASPSASSSARSCSSPSCGDLDLFPDRPHGLVLGRPGCDRADAAKAVAAATDAAAKTAAQAKLDEVLADAGMIYKLGALDFAGGTVVHINAGIAGLVGALIARQARRLRQGADGPPLADHDHDRRVAALGRLVRLQCRLQPRSERHGCPRLRQHLGRHRRRRPVVAVVEWLAKGKPSLLGMVSGASPVLSPSPRPPALPARWAPSSSGWFRRRGLLPVLHGGQERFGYDDSLDVFGIHCVGGILGAIGTGILVAPALGGTGVFDYGSDRQGRGIRYPRPGAGADQGCSRHDRLWSASSRRSSSSS